MSQKSFPIPLVEAGFLGPGTQDEGEALTYMPMPKGMNTYVDPVLPEPEEIAHCTEAAKALQKCLDSIQAQLQPTAQGGERISLLDLPEADMQVINQVLGEGEVAVTVGLAQVEEKSLERHVQIQESVFAGVWRVFEYHLGQLTQDYIEVGAIPKVVLQAVQEDVLNWKTPSMDAALAKTFINIGVLLTEIHDKSKNYQAGSQLGQNGHTINLSLLPVSSEDISYLDHRIGTGSVTILSRGYGNCRVTNACLPSTWRVVYYNSQDTVILNTVEMVDLPEAALAAPQDLIDSQERLHTILTWLEA